MRFTFAFRRFVLWLALALVLLPLSPRPAVANDASSEMGAAVPGKSAEVAVEYTAPADQPRFKGALPKVPEAPPSFNTYDGRWIRFAYPPSVRERVQPLIAEADSIRQELSSRLGQPVLDSVRVYVARTPAEMSTLAPEGAPYPKYAAGVAYSQLGLVLLTIEPGQANAVHDLGELFRHELAHVALHDAVKGRHQIPRWFNEGFAVHASGESSLTRLQTLWTATLAGNLMPLSVLERTFPADSVTASVAYAQSADVVRFLLRQRDRERFSALIDRVRSGQRFESALSDAYGLDLTNLEFEWREEVAKRYSFWPVFFSGSLVWIGALGLFVVGWRRRRTRSKQKLEQWSREEAREDAKQTRAVPTESSRVHIVLPSSREQPELPQMHPPTPSEGEVPKVEHEGDWHTLH